MTSNKSVLILSVSVAVVVFIATVGILVKPAFSDADGVATSGPIAQQDESAPLPVMAEADCNFDEWVGKSAADVETFLQGTGRPFRIIKPGQAVTMDYRADRINADLDDKGIVTRMHCS